ncbi:hypothetical protein GGI25_003453 [Coemansia spiralis]|uniref:Mitochondrial genome maintenance protein MGM101 n=2 Tax=Coemansia TaxID=4863 RepID=A0A9W8KWG9_9FUNG|nr:hypothetical protein GGI25_003453 [Coemansia spiralis]
MAIATSYNSIKSASAYVQLQHQRSITSTRKVPEIKRVLSYTNGKPSVGGARTNNASSSNYSAENDIMAGQQQASTGPQSSQAAGTSESGITDTNNKNPIEIHELNSSLFDASEGYLQDQQWSTTFQGVAIAPFEQRISDILMAPISESEIEIKPDGLLYLPEIKYRRILNRAFGPGGWGLVPRGAHSVAGRTLSREYALVCLGRFISQARGEQDFFDEGSLATATEGCKSNALVRCCKDLGIASELWDPAFVSEFKANYCIEEFVTHAVKGTKKRLWRLKTRKFDYPWTKK